jgi:hypothetical protein
MLTGMMSMGVGMTEKDREEFEKFVASEDRDGGTFANNNNFTRDEWIASITWQAACEYKQEEIVLLENQIAWFEEQIDDFMDEPDIVIKKLQAENAKLKKALQFTILAAEQQYQPNRPLEKGLCPTFYFTLSYEGDLELIEETKRARQVLTDLEKE